MSVESTLKERSRYGTFEGHSKLSQALKNLCNKHRAEQELYPLQDFQQEGLDMILHKIARIINGDATYEDNWHDIQGYAKLVEDLLLEGKAKGLAQSHKELKAPVAPKMEFDDAIPF